MRNIELLTQNGIQVDASLELLGDMEMYDETLGDFVTECETRLPLMEEYKGNSDMPNYAILVHAMKSDSKYLGFTTLAELSYQHEMESKANNVEYVMSHSEELLKEVDRILTLVKQYLG